MRSKITLAFALVLLVSCSAPKYTYYFSHYRNDVARNVQQRPEVSFDLKTDVLIASAADQPATLMAVSTVNKQIQQLTKRERVQLRRELKRFVKAQKKTGSIEPANGYEALDHDLKLAAIFGAVGIVGVALGSISQVFSIVGAIALLIGLVFFVRWIIRQ